MRDMRHVLLAIFVLFAAQPAPAALVATCDGMDGSQGMHMSMQASAHHTMDCCDHHQGATHDGCTPQSHCGGCVAAAVAIDSDISPAAFTPPAQPCFDDAQAALTGTFSPPFRPPIG